MRGSSSLSLNVMTTFVNAYSTLRTPIPWFGAGNGPTFVRSLISEDANGPFLSEQNEGSDAHELQEHLNGFAGYALNTGVERAGSYNSSIHSVFQHISRAHCHYVFERPEGYSLADFSEEFSAWGKQANSIFFLWDGSVRNGEGIDLLDPRTPEGATPPSAPHTEESIIRRDRIRGRLFEEGILISTYLPPVIGESEVVLRKPSEVRQRAQSLLTLAHIAVDVVAGQSVNVDEYLTHLQITESNLTQEETEFLAAVRRFNSFGDGQSPNYPAELTEGAFQMQWGFVAAELLAWVIGATDADPFELNPPQPAVLTDYLTHQTVRKSLRPRTLPEICDVLEYTYSMRWYAVNQTLKANEITERGGDPAKELLGLQLEPVQSSILLERHRALSWLTHPHVDYADVDLST